MKSLRVYRELYGHTLIPIKFCFESTHPGIGFAGTELGKHASKVRTTLRHFPQNFTCEQIVQLSEIEFVLDTVHARLELLLLGIKTYEKLYGTFIVPYSFVVPKNSSDWPKSIWGVNLGRKYFFLIRRFDTYPADKQKHIISSGVPVEKVLHRQANKILNMVRHYKTLHNHAAGLPLEISSQFVVPAEDSWPKEYWNEQLGMLVYSICHYKSYKSHHSIFEAEGLKIR